MIPRAIKNGPISLSHIFPPTTIRKELFDLANLQWNRALKNRVRKNSESVNNNIHECSLDSYFLEI